MKLTQEQKEFNRDKRKHETVSNRSSMKHFDKALEHFELMDSVDKQVFLMLLKSKLGVE